MDSSSHFDLIEELADEFAARQQRGEKPTIQEYVDRFPELASEIRDVFPALVMMEHVAPATDDLKDSTKSKLAAVSIEEIGDYRILREIGRGGMGIVYEAEQQSLCRRVALKVLPRSSAGDEKAFTRFQREARAAARMHHTNIVPVFEVGQDSEHAFYAMQLIQGQALDEVIVDLRQLRNKTSVGGKEADQSVHDSRHDLAASLYSGHFERRILWENESDTPDDEPSQDSNAYAETVLTANDSSSSAVLPGQSELSSAESNPNAYYHSVAEIGLQTSRALSYAHLRGIVHRDIKPSNLILDTTGVVWVTDFGLAKTGDAGLTHTGDILGTIRYMSPERFKGQCDVRADVYSLGLTLYELLTLKPAFESPDRLNLIDMVTKADVLPPRALDPRVPRDLETIVLKACDKDPKRRYQSADDMAEDLQRFIDDEPIKARRMSTRERLTRWSRRNKGLATIAVLLLIINIAGPLMYWQTEIAKKELEDNEAILKQIIADLDKEKRYSDQLAKQEERSRKAAETTAYRALVGEAGALRLARSPGYRNQGWSRLKQAFAIDTPERDVSILRMEAAASLGDFVGNEPITWEGLGTSMPEKVAVFPDSRRVALALDGGIVSIRVIESNEEVARFATGNNEDRKNLYDLMISPDGQYVVALTNKVEVWKSIGREWSRERSLDRIISMSMFNKSPHCIVKRIDRYEIINLTDPGLDRSLNLEMPSSLRPQNLRDVVISPDDSYLAGALVLNGNAEQGLDRYTIGIWNANTGDLEEHITPPLSYLATNSSAFAPDGSLVVGGAQGFVRYQRKEEHWSQVAFVKTDEVLDAKTAGDLLIVGSAARKIHLWRLNAQSEIGVLDAADISLWSHHWLGASSDGRWLISAGKTNVKLWKLKGLAEKKLIEAHETFVPDVAFSHDGKFLATTSKEKTAKLWNTVTGELVQTFQLESQGQSVAFGPDDRWLATGTMYETINHLTIWDLKTYERLGRYPTHSARLATTPDGKLVSAGSYLDTFQVNMSAASQIIELPYKARERKVIGSGICVASSPNGRWAVAASGTDLRLYDLVHFREIEGRFPTRILLSGWHNATFLPDSQHVILIGTSGKPQVWDTKTGQLSYEIQQARKFSTAHIALSPDGRWLAGAASGNALTIVDVLNRRELFTLRNELSGIKCITWHPDGHHVALGLGDGGVVIWDLLSVNEQLTDLGLGWDFLGGAQE